MNRDEYFDALQHSMNSGWTKKNAKYTSRKFENGKWVYTYDDQTTGNVSANVRNIQPSSKTTAEYRSEKAAASVGDRTYRSTMEKLGIARKEAEAKAKAELDGQKASANSRYNEEVTTGIDSKAKANYDENRKAAKKDAEWHQKQNHNLAQDQKIIDQKSADEHAKKDANREIQRDKKRIDDHYKEVNDKNTNKSLNPDSNKFHQMTKELSRTATYKDLYTSEYDAKTGEKYNTTHATRDRHSSAMEESKRRENSALFQEQKKAEEEKKKNRSVVEKGKDLISNTIKKVRKKK